MLNNNKIVMIKPVIILTNPGKMLKKDLVRYNITIIILVFVDQ